MAATRISGRGGTFPTTAAVRVAAAAMAVLAWCVPLAAERPSPERPHIVWIVSEDNSTHFMELFDPAGPATPNIETLADQGVAFHRAFSNSPVCSVARTTLATGVYAPRVGTQFHRKIREADLTAEGWRMFTWYLREGGYYATNRQKKDYNAVEGPGVWDESSGEATWRNRPSEDTPFFHMQTLAVSHEGRLHFSREQMDPDALQTAPAGVSVFPYFPETELFRYTTARYHDRIIDVDEQVGRLVDQLAEDGLLEDTFIFYFGDHGGTLPRSKGYVYEGGLHVPLVVRIPENYAHLADFERGGRTDGFVSFIDFGPTVLQLAGVKVPGHMDGQPFLGAGVTREEVERRDETFGYADRFDEKYDMVRSLRRGDYKYIRNYTGFYPDALRNNYRYRMLVYQQWQQMYQAGELDEVERQFFEPRPAEQLFDLATDPHETRNLAGDPDHAEVLADLRRRMQQRVRAMPDLSFIPEAALVERAMDSPHRFAEQHKEAIGELIETADLALLPFEEARPHLEAALASDEPWQRYWGLIACSSFGRQASPLADRAGELLGDADLLVRTRAAEFLGIIDAADPFPTLYEVLEATDSAVEALIALNTVVFVRDHLGHGVDPERLRPGAENGEVERRLRYLRGRE